MDKGEIPTMGTASNVRWLVNHLHDILALSPSRSCNCMLTMVAIALGLRPTFYFRLVSAM